MTAWITLIIIIIFTFVVIVIVLPLSMVLNTKKGTSNPTHDSSEDTQLIQEMHHGFMKMEARIDALETILLERETYSTHRGE